MEPNCERISRKAERIQWDGSNTNDVMGLLARGGLIGESFRNGEHILIQIAGRVATSIKHGTWVLMGEDGKIRFYSDDAMKLMYQPIVKNDELERLRAFARDVLDRDMCRDFVYANDIAGQLGITPESLKAPG